MPELPTQPSRTGSRKEILRNILLERDIIALIKWAKRTRNPIRTLTSFQFDNDPLICMRSVEALGKVATLYDSEPEILRRLLRRLFWMMNDESGNVGWYAPEAIGEILRNVAPLIPEYAPMLPSFLAEEPFEKGVRIAIARVAEIDKSPFNSPVRQKLIRDLEDPRPEIRGTSIVALKALAAVEAAGQVKALRDDGAKIELYDFSLGIIKSIAISDLTGDFS
jgi:hypothetical protein